MNAIMQGIGEQFNAVFGAKSSELESANKRIRELEHQHKNDEAANTMLSQVCAMQAERIRQLEGRQ